MKHFKITHPRTNLQVQKSHLQIHKPHSQSLNFSVIYLLPQHKTLRQIHICCNVISAHIHALQGFPIVGSLFVVLIHYLEKSRQLVYNESNKFGAYAVYA